MVDSVVVRWIDLGTKLVLRHVIRVLEAEQEGQISNQDRAEGDNRGEEKHSDRERDGREDSGTSTRRSKRDSNKGAATAEVDLDEVRWAECTGRAKERKPSRSTAKKLAGSYIYRLPTPHSSSLTLTTLNYSSMLHFARGINVGCTRDPTSANSIVSNVFIWPHLCSI